MPPFAYAEGDASSGQPSQVYWAWFRAAIGKRLLEKAAANGSEPEVFLSEPSAGGVIRVCAESLKSPLSKAEQDHLSQAPVSAQWIQAVLKDAAA
mmetsp:Transcript_42894/g.80009  ORF Transcript_42894/g.80009 Transcript_42894/m.80009 type:complete len:95 (+) Transcript_42894:40-324(+)